MIRIENKDSGKLKENYSNFIMSEKEYFYSHINYGYKVAPLRIDDGCNIPDVTNINNKFVNIIQLYTQKNLNIKIKNFIRIRIYSLYDDYYIVEIRKDIFNIKTKRYSYVYEQYLCDQFEDLKNTVNLFIDYD